LKKIQEEEYPIFKSAISSDFQLAAHNIPLVTGNLRHFPAKLRKRITVWTPSQFLDGFHRARRLRSSGLG